MKRVWIMNHYATDTFFEHGGRHYCFAKYLSKKGYDVAVFCASTVHNTETNIAMGERRYREGKADGIPYVFVKVPSYKGNGASRVRNMAGFYFNLFPVAREIQKKKGRPDVILASSVHPLTLLAGIQLGRKFKVPCVCEIRDLWPESIVEYSGFSRKNPLIWLLYQGERWIYKKADALIFTMAGGKKYIREKGWTRGIDPKKIHHVNNGVDLEEFDYNKEHFQVQDEDLENEDIFKVVYTGSIRVANDVGLLIRAIERLDEPEKCQLLLYGDGPDKGNLERYCKEHKLDNIKFKGKVEKKYIPYILSQSDLNIINYKQAGIQKYGGSQNKLFEYLASGKPICSNVKMGYSLIEKYHCGIEQGVSSDVEYAGLIRAFMDMSAGEYASYAQNSRKVAEMHDYKILTKKIEKILEKIRD